MARELTPAAVMAVVDDVMSEPWAWGATDCCASACDVFARLHGIDPMQAVRGSYSSAMGAVRLIQSWGGMVAMAEGLAAAADLSASDGATGDIGLSAPGFAEGPEGRALLICIQPGAWAGKAMDGFVILPNAERCWRV